MSKNKVTTSVKRNKVNLEKDIMPKVTSGKIAMKPKWYFVIGSLLSVIGIAAFSVTSLFLVNLMIFLLRKHGPMGQWRLEAMLESFPLWIPILATFGIIGGIWLLKKCDFSYKKNFFVIIVGFVVSIIITGFIIDQLGLNDIWSRRGLMKGFYQRIENQDGVFQFGPGKGVLQNGRGNGYNRN